MEGVPKKPSEIPINWSYERAEEKKLESLQQIRRVWTLTKTANFKLLPRDAITSKTICNLRGSKLGTLPVNLDLGPLPFLYYSQARPYTTFYVDLH